MTDETPDIELLQRWRDGDTAAASILIRRHFTSVFRYFAANVAETEAEDLTQRTFEACIDNRDRIRDESGVRPYLFGIARNQLAMHLRNALPRRADSPPSQVELPDPRTSPSGVLRNADEAQALERALGCLSDKLREVIDLYYREERNVAEIAARLGVSGGTVKSRLFRARAQLIEEIRALGLPAGLEASTVATLPE